MFEEYQGLVNQIYSIRLIQLATMAEQRHMNYLSMILNRMAVGVAEGTEDIATLNGDLKHLGYELMIKQPMINPEEIDETYFEKIEMHLVEKVFEAKGSLS